VFSPSLQTAVVFGSLATNTAGVLGLLPKAIGPQIPFAQGFSELPIHLPKILSNAYEDASCALHRSPDIASVSSAMQWRLHRNIALHNRAPTVGILYKMGTISGEPIDKLFLICLSC